MIEFRREKCGWEFIFLGANIDAAKEAKKYGINENMAANYNCDKEGTAVCYDAINLAVTNARKISVPMTDNWKKKIDEDYARRGRKR